MIVVTDNHKGSAEFLARQIQLGGRQACVCSSGQELLTRLEREPLPALVILDVMMPQMSGIECLQRIRANAAWDAVPVVMYTADTSEQTVRESKRCGAQGVLVKGMVPWSQLKAFINEHARDVPDEKQP